MIIQFYLKFLFQSALKSAWNKNISVILQFFIYKRSILNRFGPQLALLGQPLRHTLGISGRNHNPIGATDEQALFFEIRTGCNVNDAYALSH